MRTNPIKNPSFETNLTGYTTQGATTQTRDTTEFLFGTASMKCVAAIGTRAAVYGASGAAVANADAIPVSPYDIITFSAYVKWTTTPTTTWVKIHWFTAAGAWISDTDSSLAYTPPGSTWTRLSVTGIAPTNAAKYGVAVTCSGAGTFYTDGWLAEKSPIADTYFDGSTTGVTGYTHAWTGTAHASSSTATSTGTRTNLVVNPSFETGVANWTGTSMQRGNALTLAPGIISGSYCMHFGGGGTEYLTDAIAATPGAVYTASAWFCKTTTASRPVAVSVHFYDSGGVEISAPTVTTTALNNDSIPERRAMNRTAPAGTVTAKVKITSTSAVGNVQCDAVMLEQSPYLDDYFDGDTLATTISHSWAGTAHASASKRVSYDLTTTVTGTPTYNAGNAKFGSLGLSGGAIKTSQAVGPDDFLSATKTDGGALTTGTVEAWVKVTTAGSLKIIASHPGWWYLGMDSAGKAFLEYGWNTGGYTQLTGTTTIGNGAWHHVAMVLTVGAGSLYVDGTREATSAVTRSAVGFNGDKFMIGTHTNNPGAFLWPGSIDEVRISTVARYTGTTYTVPTARFAADKSTSAVYRLEGSGAATPAGVITVKARESGAWVSRPAISRYRSNGVWKVANPKRWNGAWVDLN